MLLSEHAKLLSFIWNSHQNLSSSITELLGLDSLLLPVQSPAASPSASFGAYIRQPGNLHQWAEGEAEEQVGGLRWDTCPRDLDRSHHAFSQQSQGETEAGV